MATKLDVALLEYYSPDYKKRSYWLNILLAFDQFLNSLLAGYCDETLSSRAFRENHKIAEKLINTLFFWDKQETPEGVIRHCQLAYYGELMMEHFPRIKEG